MAGSFDRAGFVRVDMALYSTVNAVEGAQCCADDRQVGLRAACHKMYVDIAAAAFFFDQQGCCFTVWVDPVTAGLFKISCCQCFQYFRSAAFCVVAGKIIHIAPLPLLVFPFGQPAFKVCFVKNRQQGENNDTQRNMGKIVFDPGHVAEQITAADE